MSSMLRRERREAHQPTTGGRRFALLAVTALAAGQAALLLAAPPGLVRRAGVGLLVASLLFTLAVTGFARRLRRAAGRSGPAVTVPRGWWRAQAVGGPCDGETWHCSAEDERPAPFVVLFAAGQPHRYNLAKGSRSGGNGPADTTAVYSYRPIN